MLLVDSCVKWRQLWCVTHRILWRKEIDYGGIRFLASFQGTFVAVGVIYCAPTANARHCARNRRCGHNSVKESAVSQSKERKCYVIKAWDIPGGVAGSLATADIPYR